ncbi:MAG: QueG-associated DUF1730 domain-containing protein [Planctomycetota bacterium]
MDRPAEDAWHAIDTARELGFALAGVAPAEPSRHAEHVRQWIAQGNHGEMAYLANHLDIRLDPRELLPGARSIVMVADAYPSEAGGTAESESASPDPTAAMTDFRGRGKVARYAWGADYHKTIKKRLHRLADRLRRDFDDEADHWKACVDTAPLLEREHAAAAGLGFIGRNTLLIHPRHGSYVLLGALVTTRELAPSSRLIELEPQRAKAIGLVAPADRCGHCTRCIDACPTGCITDPRPGSSDGASSQGEMAGGLPGAPRAIDATRCISYLTIEHRGELAEDLRNQLDGWVAGCDVCQEVCPFNDAGERRPLPIHPKYRPRAEVARGLPLHEVAAWTEDDHARVAQGSALKRIKLPMWRRNAQANLDVADA